MKKIALLLLSVVSLSANQLQKVYLHRAPHGQQLEETPQLELTKLVFYFSEKPTMHTIVHNDPEKTGWKHETFFFTLDTVDNACKAKLKDIQQNDTYYRIACTEVDHPRKGVRVELFYDPDNIACLCDTFDAITNHKGVAVRLVNKPFLNQMGSFERPLLQLASNKKPHVVIDCGHGGTDPGAIGFNAITEKDVTLGVGHSLAHLLKKKGCEVTLTRETDTFVSLDKRTEIINTIKPNAYISIHANSAGNKDVHGIETYCLHPNLFTVVQHAPSDQSLMFRELIKKNCSDSYHLAQKVHADILHHVNQQVVNQQTALHDRKVKHAVPQLLLGTNFPGILVELGFLTHPKEAQRLAQSDYQQQLAQGICNGLMHFLHI
ncbi:MAG: N-acetylmuramoyl-L-alanine amidase [Candidatus Dependentiae bacterium]